MARLRTTPVCAVVLLLWSGLSLRGEAAEYHFSALGFDDTGDGSLEKPWASIAKANTLDLEPGDQVLFRGGDTFSSAVALSLDASDAGTTANPVRITSYGTRQAVISITANDQSGLVAKNVAGLEVRNLQFIGTGRSTAEKTALFFESNLPHVTLEYLRLENIQASGFRDAVNVFCWGWEGSNYTRDSVYKDIIFSNSEFAAMGQGGISTWGDHRGCIQDITVRNCKIYDVAGASGNSGSGIVLGWVDRALIEHCEVFNTGYGNTGTSAGPVGIWCYESNAVVMQFNESHHNKTGPNNYDGGGFDIDGGSTNCVVQYNYSHDNYGPGFLFAQYSGSTVTMSNNVVRYNISENDGKKNGKGAIHFWNGNGATKNIDGTDVYGNTIYVNDSIAGTPAAVLHQSGSVANIRIRNNLFIAGSGRKLIQIPSNTAAYTFQGNAYYTTAGAASYQWGANTYTSLAQWRTASNQEIYAGEALGFEGDPKLTAYGSVGTIGDTTGLAAISAYRLKPDSPLRDAGLDLTALFALDTGGRDFFGNSQPQAAWDIGAHEFHNSAPVAHAGPDQTLTLTVGEPSIAVQLDASASTDPDTDPLTYSWQEGETDVAVGVQPSVLLTAGRHELVLTVSDGVLSSTAQVVIVVQAVVKRSISVLAWETASAQPLGSDVLVSPPGMLDPIEDNITGAWTFPGLEPSLDHTVDLGPAAGG